MIIAVHIDDPFVYPRKTSRVKNNYADKSNTIKTSNQFDILDTMPLSDGNRFDFDDNSAFNMPASIGSNKSKRKTYRSTTIIGDSIIKDVKQYKMKKHLPKGDKIYIKSFSGATTDAMVDYVKPSLRYNPDLLILHTGVNNLRSKESPEVIADDIINLARDIKSNLNDIVVSGLVSRNDDLKYKGEQVNEYLISKCAERNIFYIDNSNINPRQYLNSTNHLNFKGTELIMQNFLECVNV